MPDEIHNPYPHAVRHHLARSFRLRKKTTHLVFSQPGFVGHAPRGYLQQTKIAGVRAGDEIQVEKPALRTQLLHIGIVPEGHAKCAVFRHALPPSFKRCADMQPRNGPPGTERLHRTCTRRKNALRQAGFPDGMRARGKRRSLRFCFIYKCIKM